MYYILHPHTRVKKARCVFHCNIRETCYLVVRKAIPLWLEQHCPLANQALLSPLLETEHFPALIFSDLLFWEGRKICATI